MEDQINKPEAAQEQVPKFRGLYRHVKISVKTLDRIIVACIAVILIVVIFELMNPGLAITFDSKGGTDVPGINQEYGELLEVPASPTREGYRFTGWYTDEACEEQWDTESRTIETDMTLYAGWEKAEQSES